MSEIKTAATREASFSERLLALFLDYPAERIPQSAVRAVQLCMKDTIGVALAGGAFGVGTSGLRVAAEAGGPAESTVWGGGFSASRVDAALANGMLAHALDFDDTHPAAIMHSSTVNIPVALAIGEAIKAPASEILSAAILGSEVSARLGRLGAGPFQDHGFQSTAVLGVFASTFIAARLLKVNASVARNAMGIAGSMASGLMEYLSDGTDVKQMHPGWAAQAGIRAVQLARAGLSGPATVLEGRFGVFKAYARLDIDPEAVLSFDGSRFEVEEMAPKPYPACLCVHPMVQGTINLRARGVFDRLDMVEDIHCEVPQWYVDLVFEPSVQKVAARNAYEGRFSAQFCVARAALDGKLGVKSFLPENITDPEVARIAGKVSYRARPFAEFPETFPALVRVRLTDGSVHEASVPHNLGSAKLPMGEAGVNAKFRDNVIFAISESSADRLDAAIKNMQPGKPTDSLWSALKEAKLRH